MNIENVLLDEFTQCIYNDVNQAGEEMIVIDASDLNICIANLVKKLNIYSVSQQRELLFSFVKKYNSGNTHSDKDIENYEVNDFLENYRGEH